jgi:hypothetical protein
MINVDQRPRFTEKEKTRNGKNKGNVRSATLGQFLKHEKKEKKKQWKLERKR